MKLAFAAAVSLLLLAPAVRAADAVPPSGEVAKSRAPKKAPVKHKKKAAAAKKKKAVPESKYKSPHALSASTDEHYLFDEDGNPVDKKKRAKAKKKSSADGADKPACSSDEPCSDSKSSSDADAL